MQLIARKAITYGGARVAVGEEFAATRKDGKVLVAIGKARARPDRLVQLASLTVELPEAESAEVTTTVDGHQVEPDEPTHIKPKRAYNRRDMSAKS